MSLSVLVVEDDPHINSALKRKLEGEKFTVYVATNGVEGLESRHYIIGSSNA